MRKKGPSPEKAEEIRLKRDIGKFTKMKQLRLDAGLSQSELSKKTKIPITTIQKYETGVRPIDGAKLSTLCQICLVLDCKIVDILESNIIIKKFNQVR